MQRICTVKNIQLCTAEPDEVNSSTPTKYSPCVALGFLFALPVFAFCFLETFKSRDKDGTTENSYSFYVVLVRDVFVPVRAHDSVASLTHCSWYSVGKY